MRTTPQIASIVLALYSVLGATAYGETTVPEPPGLWPGPMHSATPSTLKGATVIDGKRLEAIVEDQKPVLIDVANLQHKPSNLPASTIWEPIHRSIPGATWLPGGGSGRKDAHFTQAFDAEIEKVTGGDKDKPIVTFCHPQRWGSWNAAKRLVDLGYRHVYWFPGGAEGWGDEAEMVPVQEDASWKSVDIDKTDASTPKEQR